MNLVKPLVWSMKILQIFYPSCFFVVEWDSFHSRHGKRFKRTRRDSGLMPILKLLGSFELSDFIGTKAQRCKEKLKEGYSAATCSQRRLLLKYRSSAFLWRSEILPRSFAVDLSHFPLERILGSRWRRLARTCRRSHWICYSRTFPFRLFVLRFRDFFVFSMTGSRLNSRRADRIWRRTRFLSNSDSISSSMNSKLL